LIASAAGKDGAADRQRIDKWLWHARVVRTRSDAARLMTSGHVRVNGQRVTAPAHPLRAGDVVTLALDRSVRLMEVAGFSEKRGDAAQGRRLYRDMTERDAVHRDGPARYK
jgi:ribosome-associated heat shock protein Hsp15